MGCLEDVPIVHGPMLDGSADVDWGPTEALQIVAEGMSTEAVMRTFNSLDTDYGLSVPVVRIVRTDGLKEARRTGSNGVHRPEPQPGGAVNILLPSRYDEVIHRLALGIEPVDALTGTRVATALGHVGRRWSQGRRRRLDRRACRPGGLDADVLTDARALQAHCGPLSSPPWITSRGSAAISRSLIPKDAFAEMPSTRVPPEAGHLQAFRPEL